MIPTHEWTATVLATLQPGEWTYTIEKDASCGSHALEVRGVTPEGVAVGLRRAAIEVATLRVAPAAEIMMLREDASMTARRSGFSGEPVDPVEPSDAPPHGRKLIGQEVRIPDRGVRVFVTPHPFDDAADAYEDGVPGRCAFPFCTLPPEEHVEAAAHDCEEHPELPGRCRVCGLVLPRGESPTTPLPTHEDPPVQLDPAAIDSVAAWFKALPPPVSPPVSPQWKATCGLCGQELPEPCPTSCPGCGVFLDKRGVEHARQLAARRPSEPDPPPGLWSSGGRMP